MAPTAHVKATSLQAKCGSSAGTNSRHQVGRELPLRVAVAFCGNCERAGASPPSPWSRRARTAAVLVADRATLRRHTMNVMRVSEAVDGTWERGSLEPPRWCNGSCEEV